MMKIINIFIIIALSFIAGCSNQPTIKVEMDSSVAYELLRKHGYKEINDNDEMEFLSGAKLWLSKNNTCFLIVQYHPEPHSKIYMITIGEKGKGFLNRDHWLNQKLTDVDEFKL